MAYRGDVCNKIDLLGFIELDHRKIAGPKSRDKKVISLLRKLGQTHNQPTDRPANQQTDEGVKLDSFDIIPNQRKLYHICALEWTDIVIHKMSSCFRPKIVIDKKLASCDHGYVLST